MLSGYSVTGKNKTVRWLDFRKPLNLLAYLEAFLYNNGVIRLSFERGKRYENYENHA